jgi:gluconolactonase
MTSLESLLASDVTLTRAATGATWSEGPCWIPSDETLRWSDIHGNRILQYSPSTGETSTYRTKVEFTNGRTLHPAGYVVQCSHGHRRVEIDDAGAVRVLVDSWSGGRFNSPNDVVVASDHAVWFTDPHYGITVHGEGHPGNMEYGSCYVFRWDPDTGAAIPVITDMEEPNGLAFSPDESVLYVSDTSAVRRPPGVGNHHVAAYDVSATAKGVECVNGRTVFQIPQGIPDGFRVDERGNIWSSGPDGVYVYAPEGTFVGHIPVPELVGNLCFGGPDGYDLYIAATSSIYHVRAAVRDAAWRGA